MVMILDPSVDDYTILGMLQTLVGSNEMKAVELSVGERTAEYGTLMHCCAVAGTCFCAPAP